MTMYVTHHADVDPVNMLPGVERRTLAVTDRIMLCEFHIKGGSEVPIHAHPHDQAGYVVSGEAIMIIDGREYVCGPGDAYAIPGGVEHGARFRVDTVIVDVFSPPREDYLDNK